MMKKSQQDERSRDLTASNTGVIMFIYYTVDNKITTYTCLNYI